MFFSDCIECELFVVGMIVVAGVMIDYISCKKRKWGENPKKWGKR